MKKYFIFLAFILLGCDNKIITSFEKETRIKMVDQYTTTDNKTIFYIIEVDGKEFIVQLHGGMCPLLKKDKK